MTTLNTKIAGINVELELFEENGEARSNCYLSVTKSRVEYTGSLELLECYGHLESSEGDELKIETKTCDRIHQWAVDNGY